MGERMLCDGKVTGDRVAGRGEEDNKWGIRLDGVYDRRREEREEAVYGERQGDGYTDTH